MGMNKMEFQWRLNWWYRPTQLDGFGTSVADYYDCFCDWKAIMKLNGCPADEADYVEAFIQNLKPDIRLRLESKGISRMRRLSDVLSDAKFEESMIFLEETIKKFKAKFEAPLEAHNPFDKVPSLVSVDNQEHSSDDEVLEESEELSGLEDDDNDSSTAYETSIDEIEEEEIDEMLVKLEDNPVKDVSSNADDKVFDELPKPALTTTTSYKLLDDDFNVYSELNSQTGATFDQVLGSSGDEARKLLNKATGIQLMKVEGSFLTKQTDLKIDKKVFDEMPRLFFVEAKEKINGGMDSITPIDCVPRVFDPGSVTTKNVYKNESSINEREGKFTPPLMPSSISLKDIGAAVNLGMKDELSQPSVIATAGSKLFSGKSYSIFDPGISISFKDIRVATSLHNKLFQPSIIATTGLKSNSEQCYSFVTFLGQCKTFSFTSNDMVIIFDPGGRKNGIHNLGSNQHSKVMEENTAIAFLENTSSNGETREHLIMFGHPNAVCYVSWLFKSILEIFGDFRSWHLKGCACIHSREMPCSLVVFIQLGKVLMVVFDPGGSWYHMRYHFQLNGELTLPTKCLKSQAAQQLFDKMLSRQLMIASCSDKVVENRADSVFAYVNVLPISTLPTAEQPYVAPYICCLQHNSINLKMLYKGLMELPTPILGECIICTSGWGEVHTTMSHIVVSQCYCSSDVLENFVWDPGLWAIIICILEDKGVRVAEGLKGPFSLNNAHSELALYFEEAPGVNKMINAVILDNAIYDPVLGAVLAGTLFFYTSLGTRMTLRGRERGSHGDSTLTLYW